VTTKNCATGVLHDVKASLNHPSEDIEGDHIAWPSNELESGERIGPHCVHITQGVRCGDPAPVVWIIDYWCKEIDRLDDGSVSVNAKDAGVI
jgi:hypothetical protein